MRKFTGYSTYLNGSIGLFKDIGDCRGDNDKLNQMIQTAFDKAQNGRITILTVQDNVGISTIGGGMTTVIIFKSDYRYAPIVGLKYSTPSVMIGTVTSGKFDGFKILHN